MLDASQLKQKYNAPVFATIEDLLASSSSANIDGIIICTPHSTHAHIGLKAIEQVNTTLNPTTLTHLLACLFLLTYLLTDLGLECTM